MLSGRVGMRRTRSAEGVSLLFAEGKINRAANSCHPNSMVFVFHR